MQTIQTNTEQLTELLADLPATLASFETTQKPSPLPKKILSKALSLIKKGINPQAKVTLYSNVKIPLLSVACALLSEPLIKALLDAGADAQAKVKVGPGKELVTPLWSALKQRDCPDSVITLLLSSGATLFDEIPPSLQLHYEMPNQPQPQSASQAGNQLAFELLFFFDRPEIIKKQGLLMTSSALLFGIKNFMEKKRFNNIVALSLLDLLVDHPLLESSGFDNIRRQMRCQLLDKDSSSYISGEKAQTEMIKACLDKIEMETITYSLPSQNKEPVSRKNRL